MPPQCAGSTIREFQAIIDRRSPDRFILEVNFYELKATDIWYGQIIESRDHTSVMNVFVEDKESPPIGTVFTIRSFRGARGSGTIDVRNVKPIISADDPQHSGQNCQLLKPISDRHDPRFAVRRGMMGGEN